MTGNRHFIQACAMLKQCIFFEKTNMPSIKSTLILLLLSSFCISAMANSCCNRRVDACCNKQVADGCCSQMGGVSYCDSSAGRLVCRNGFYSTCYCTRHAVMDLQLLTGCCLWHGGVTSTINLTGLVSCNDGSVSEECSLGQPTDKIASY